MSLLTGLTTERKLGGVAVLSGWLPLNAKFKAVCAHTLLLRKDGTHGYVFQDGLGPCEEAANFLGTWT